MTDGLNNPNELPDEDWAMNTPEVPIKKEPQVQPIDEKAASLYAPPDTGDLEGWDINSQESNLSEITPPPEPPVNPPPQQFSAPSAFTPPQQSFEVLKPVATPKIKDDWGMGHSNKNDGWKMPEPTFRATEGEILTKVRGKSSASSNNPAIALTDQEKESLPDIYSPPDTQEESSEPITEDFSVPDTQEEISFQADLANQMPQAPTFQQATVNSAEPKKSKSWLFIIVGLFLAGLLIVLILAVVFGFFFYKANPT